MTEIIYLIVGIVLGLMIGGIKINIYHKDKSTNEKVEYNQTPIDALPDEIKEYAKLNKGFINF